MEKLTKKQEEVLICIKKYIAKYGYSPSIREICEMMNLNSTATSFVHLKHLIKKGYIKQTENKFRTIELLVPNEYADKKSDILSVPLLNKKSCKNIFNYLENPKDYIKLPGYICSKKETIFALKIHDNSLSFKGIYEGDILVIKKAKSANNGDIILVLNENKEILLKIFYKGKGNDINFKPESENINLNNLEIIGIVTGLYRKI